MTPVGDLNKQEEYMQRAIFVKDSSIDYTNISAETFGTPDKLFGIVS